MDSTTAIIYDINKYLEVTKILEEYQNVEWRGLTPRVYCKDGFNVSVQVGTYTYCEPRENDAISYHNVELGYPSAVDKHIMPFCEDGENPLDTVYPYVPVNIVNIMITDHGGIDVDRTLEEHKKIQKV